MAWLFRQRAPASQLGEITPHMPFIDQLSTAIATAQLNQLDHLGRSMWSALAQGSVTEAEAQRLADLIEERRGPRQPVTNSPVLKAPRSIFRTGRVPPRSPDRQRSMERRRRVALSGKLPSPLAGSFTMGEAASLAVIAEHAGRTGCTLSLGEIAGRAGVSVSTARRAVREAQRQGLVKVDERRRHRAPSLTNVITIVSREWKTWLERGPKRSKGEGFKNGRPRIPILSEEALGSPQKAQEKRGKKDGGFIDPPRRRR